jgi:hypothetical protein
MTATKTTPKKRESTQRKQEKMLDALKRHLGVVKSACEEVGINRTTHYKWMKQSESYAEAVVQLEDDALDMVENELFNQIKNGSTAATIFYLKTKGKRRGYIERQEIDVAPREPDLSDLSTDEIRQLLETSDD